LHSKFRFDFLFEQGLAELVGLIYIGRQLKTVSQNIKRYFDIF